MKSRHRFAPFLGLFVSILWSSAALSQCTAPATWFPHSQTPKPDDTIAPNSNCAFHQWAWQEFLWLTQPDGQGHLRFMSMPTASDLFDTGTTPPIAANSLPKGRMLVLKPRTIQTQGPTSLGDILQANSRGILVDQNGRSVYYASAINDVFFDFVRTNNLFKMAGYDAASPTLNFPVGSLELKSSWMVVPDGQVAPSFFTTKAQINPLVCNDGGSNCKGADILLDQSQTRTATVALVGLHVVGVVQDHPEFIWATFEHKDNAPNLPAGMSPTAPTPVDTKNWTFYKANTLANACNLSDNAAVNPSITLVDPATQILSPITNVFRQAAFGGGSSQNQANIQALNSSVATQLGVGDVFSNYRLTGGVWMGPNALVPGLNQNSIKPLLAGSLALANPTMETFTQTGSCFTCHNTAQQRAGGTGFPAKNLNLSHILLNNLAQDAGAAMLNRK
jgi:hypothetical protein